MTTRYAMKKALLAKAEVTYGTDPTPTGGANAILAANVSFDPSLGEEVPREIIQTYMGHQGVILTGDYAKISYEVEMAGAGAAGTAPKYGPCLQGCGFAEVITAGTDVQYTPVSGSFVGLTHYFNWDGVKHIMLGCRGTMKFDLSTKKSPRFMFEFTGLIGTYSDAALPAVTTTGFKKPVAISKANTTLALHGYTGGVEAFSADLGGKVEPRLLINKESVEITGREATGEVQIEADTLANIDWFGISKAHTEGALAFTHGVVAGNIVQIDCPAVQIGRPKYSESQNIVNYTLPLMIKPSAGNDEMKITVK